MPMQVYITPLRSRMEIGPPPVVAKMPVIDVFFVDGGRSQISISLCPIREPVVDVS
jgi:hypothetical protein